MSTPDNDDSLVKPEQRYQDKGNYLGPGSVFSERLNMPIQGDFNIKWNDSGKCEIRWVGNAVTGNAVTAYLLQ